MWRLPMIEMRDGPPVFSFDPGKLTGYAYLFGDHVVVGEADCDDALVLARDAINSISVKPIIVCESFIVNAETAKKTQAPWSLESIGVLRFLARRHDLQFILQPPVEAKTFSTNTRLKHAGWYKSTPGGHTNDAIRHLYLHLTKTHRMRPPPGVV